MCSLFSLWALLSVGIFEILLVWFCASMWVFDFLNSETEEPTLIICGFTSLISVLVYGIACTSIPRRELRHSDKRKRMASQRGHMTILMYGLGCGAPGELLRISYKSGYNGEKGASIKKVWRAFIIHQLAYTAPQVVMHIFALRSVQNEITWAATSLSLSLSCFLLMGLIYTCIYKPDGSKSPIRSTR